MKPIGIYNRLPKTFKLPEKLKPGKSVTYKLVSDFESHLIISRDGAKEKTTRWPESIQIPTLDTIMISYKDDKGEEQTDLFDIGMVRNIDKDGNPNVDPFWLDANMRLGEFTLTGDSVEHQQLHTYFELCNFNQSNENRDKAKKAYFYKVDLEADANKKNRQVDLELDCLLFIRNCTPKEIRKLAAAFQLNENDADSRLRAQLNAQAKANPEEFNRLATSKDVETKATIQRAFLKQVIKYVPAQHKIVWGSNNSTIATLQRVEGVVWQEQFNDWIKTHKNGQATYENIVKLLDEK